jgi:hypothetical protein
MPPRLSGLQTGQALLECGDLSPLAQTSKLPQNGSLLPLYGETPDRLQAYCGLPGGEPPVCGSIGLVQAATSRRTPEPGARLLSVVYHDSFAFREQDSSLLWEPLAAWNSTNQAPGALPIGRLPLMPPGDLW